MREITELVQSHKLDLIIETRDARLPLTSINPAFERLLAEQAGRSIGAPTSAAGGGKGFGTTKRLIVYNKADLAQDCFQIVSLAAHACLHSPAKHAHSIAALEQPLQRALAQHDEDQVLFTDSRSDHEVKRVLEAAISKLRITDASRLRACTLTLMIPQNLPEDRWTVRTTRSRCSSQACPTSASPAY